MWNASERRLVGCLSCRLAFWSLASVQWFFLSTLLPRMHVRCHSSQVSRWLEAFVQERVRTVWEHVITMWFRWAILSEEGGNWKLFMVGWYGWSIWISIGSFDFKACDREILVQEGNCLKIDSFKRVDLQSLDSNSFESSYDFLALIFQHSWSSSCFWEPLLSTVIKNMGATDTGASKVTSMRSVVWFVGYPCRSPGTQLMNRVDLRSLCMCSGLVFSCACVQHVRKRGG